MYFDGETCKGCIYVGGAQIWAQSVGAGRARGNRPHCLRIKSCAPRKPVEGSAPLVPDHQLRGQSEWVLDCMTAENQGPFAVWKSRLARFASSTT